MRRVALITSVFLAFAEPAWAAGQHATNSTATNTGSSVSVRAEEISTGPGGGGGGQGNTRARPGIDHRAAYARLYEQMARSRVHEEVIRAREHHQFAAMQQAHQRCVELARHFDALAVRRVRQQVRVPVLRTYVIWEMRRVTIREGRLTRTVYRPVPVPRAKTVWVTTTRWVTVRDPAAAAQAALARRCADHARAALTRLSRQIVTRRAAWEASWSALNRAAHDAWRAFNTTCRTVRSVGDTDVQQCTYEAWRNFAPGGFERTVTVPPPRPPDDLIRRARDQITPPGPVIRMSPRVEWEQIVQLPTWMWIDPGAWRPRTARAEAGRTWAEATATPARVVWDMGNGDRVVCEGPGTPYDEGRHEATQRTGCSYTYRKSSAGQPGDTYTVRATLVYDVGWEGSAGAGGNLGTITRTSTARIRVAELQALVDHLG